MTTTCVIHVYWGLASVGNGIFQKQYLTQKNFLRENI